MYKFPGPRPRAITDKPRLCLKMRRADAVNQSSGHAMQSLLYPVANEREALRRQGLQPKNHHRENMKALKEIQKKNAEVSNRPSTAPEPFKLARFKSVESQVRKTLEVWGLDESGAGEKSRPATARSFTKRGEGLAKMELRMEEAKMRRGSHDDRRERVITKPPVPKREECETPPIGRGCHDEVNFLKKNAIAAIKGCAGSHSHAKGVNPAPADRHESFGRVPGYILARKEAALTARRGNEARLVDQPLDCPPGMRLLKEDERQTTLEELGRARLGLLESLAGLPFIIDTPSLQARKADLEGRLVQVDGAIALYSRKRLFVQA